MITRVLVTAVTLSLVGAPGGTPPAVALVLPESPPPPVDRELRAEVIVDAGIEDVWQAWTTPAGIRSFFARGCNVELRVGGCSSSTTAARGCG